MFDLGEAGSSAGGDGEGRPLHVSSEGPDNARAGRLAFQPLPMSSPPTLLRHLSRRHRRGPYPRWVLHEASREVEADDLVASVGPSGRASVVRGAFRAEGPPAVDTEPSREGHHLAVAELGASAADRDSLSG